eukprot:GILI01009682.1.p1 GENE.GILI01009682.1~~GILI01009682.1.p1  ORF type:complete len:354 (-),score=126.35 GILI01009682.1:126-1187(-)
MPAKKQPLVASSTPVKRTMNESLLATDTERHATSKSLYGDFKARISANVSTIHDNIRNNAYKQIMGSLQGKTVLHLGCGMGLISMLAARAAAKHVVAVDTSAIVDCARVVAEQNQLKNITFIRGKIQEVAAELPFKKFDVVLCEWMGAFLTNEEDYANIIYCRENLLAENGVMCPDQSSIHVVGISDYPYRRDNVDYWDNVYGFKMEPMKALVLEEAGACAIPRTCIATNTNLAYTLDIKTASLDKREYSFPFTLKADRKTTLHFLTFYVSAQFVDKTDKNFRFALDMRAGGPNPWTEVSVPLENQMPVNPNDVITGTVSVKPLGKLTEVNVTAECKGTVTTTTSTGRYYYTY